MHTQFIPTELLGDKTKTPDLKFKKNFFGVLFSIGQAWISEDQIVLYRAASEYCGMFRCFSITYSLSRLYLNTTTVLHFS